MRFNPAWFFLIGLAVSLVLVFGGGVAGSEDVGLSPWWKNIFVRSPVLEDVPLFDEIAREKRIEKIRFLGKSVQKQGDVEVIIADDFENLRSEKIYYLSEGNKKYRLYSNELDISLSGLRVSVTGKQLGEEFVVENFEIVSEAGGGRVVEDNPNLGEQSILMVLVYSQDNPSEPITVEEAWNRTFSDGFDEDEDGFPDSISSYVNVVSYGKAFVTGDVIGWYNLPISENDLCSINLLRDAVVEAVDSDVYFPDYNRLMVVFPVNSLCGAGGRGTIGVHDVSTDDGPVRFSTSYLNGPQAIDNGIGVHELGHNFGVLHANDWECGEFIIGGDCESIKYGDFFDTMGAYRGRGHFNAVHMDRIGWFSDSNVVEGYNLGTWMLEPIEINGSNVKALRIPISENKSYWIEYRRPILYDTFNSIQHGSEIYDGAILHLWSLWLGSTQLLDMSPHASTLWSQKTDSLDVILRSGEFFYDPENDIMVNVLNVTDDFLEIHLGSLSCGDGIVQIGEDCDGTNLAENDCESLGFNEGSLSCDSECRFNVTQCFNVICPIGEYNGEGTCTVVFDSISGDGDVLNGGSSWEETHDADAGTLSDFIGRSISVGSSGISLHNIYSIERGFIPFDTSTLPDDVKILSSELKVHLSSVINTDNDGEDFLVVVRTTQEEEDTLVIEDFDQCGFINNPIEGSDRIDFSNLFSGEDFVFVLNYLDWIDKQGITKLGLREGHDVLDLPISSDGSNKVAVVSNQGNIFFSPKLIINYTVPLCGNGVIDEGEECDDGNDDNWDGCSNSCRIWPICTDTDPENDVFVKGLVTIGGSEYLDVCSRDNNKVEQFTCTIARRPPTIGFTSCVNGCDDGACVRESIGGGGKGDVVRPGLVGVQDVGSTGDLDDGAGGIEGGSVRFAPEEKSWWEFWK